MSSSFEWSLRVADFISQPRALWNAGLKQAGLAWISTMQHYPPAPPRQGLQGLYTRTGTLGHKAKPKIVKFGQEMDLMGVFYTRYLLLGTGIYGPRHRPITPVHAKFLVFGASGRGGVVGHKLVASGFSKRKGGLVHNSSRDQYLVFARSVRGTIWRGKLDEVKKNLIEAFIRGVKSYKPHYRTE